MRIGVNATILGARPSGLGIYAANIVREFGRLRNGLVVYTSSAQDLRGNGLELRKVSSVVRPERGLIGHVARLLWLQTMLPARVWKDRVRVLLNTVPEGMLTPVIPQVTVVHDLLPLVFPDEYPRQQHFFRYLVPSLLRVSRLVVADSENTRRDIIRSYGISPEKIHTVHIGCDRGRFRPEATRAARTRPNSERYILYVGNLFPHKNLGRLLEAFSVVAGRHACKLVVAGAQDPRYYPALKARAVALALEGRVVFLDYVPAEELPALYANAALGVWPSLYEGFGLPPLEAMACGTPVIVSNAGSLPEVVGEAGLLVDPLDVDALAGAMVRVLTDDVLRAELGERGLARSKQFSWEETACRTLSLCQEAYAGGKQT